MGRQLYPEGWSKFSQDCEGWGRLSSAQSIGMVSMTPEVTWVMDINTHPSCSRITDTDMAYGSVPVPMLPWSQWSHRSPRSVRSWRQHDFGHQHDLKCLTRP